MPHDLFLASYSSVSASLADPAGPSAIVAAMAWLQGTLLGTLATTVAVIAVAWVGMMMLAGRVSIRYGLTVVLGCFILFGASTIVAGIRSTMAGTGMAAAPPPAPPPSVPPVPPARAGNSDPYAGASVPTR